MAFDTSSVVVVVGAGCFGLSTAYHLLKRGFTRITVLDRSAILPAPEAASTDLNKVVRSAYSDIFYARLAREAISEWKDEKEWGDAYHESGVFVHLSGTESYADKAYQSDLAIGARISLLPDASAVKSVFPPGVEITTSENSSGYINLDGGWANASKGVSTLMEKVTALGGNIVPGKAVSALVKTGGKTTGVACADGSTYDADVVVLSAGSWTASTFPDLQLGEKCLATGQCVSAIQLSLKEVDLYKNCPVYLDLNTGFYVFPPNENGMMKFALHSDGYTHMLGLPGSDAPISIPAFPPAVDVAAGSSIPRSAMKAAREAFAKVYPALARKPIAMTRLCWYTDSPDEDWVIGFHPADPTIMLATAGSGHAYKFLPVIGRLVADAIQGVMEPELVQKFALYRSKSTHIGSRPGLPVTELDFSDLCTTVDLLPQQY